VRPRACLPNLGVVGVDGRPMTRTEVLADVDWVQLEPLLPSSAGVRGRPFRDHRQVLEGIFFRYRTGCAWRDLPAEFGPWQTVWKRHHRFSSDGTWDRILTALQARADAAGRLDWRVSVDSSISRVHQHGATAARTPGGPSELQESVAGAG
jgi:transposase